MVLHWCYTFKVCTLDTTDGKNPSLKKQKKIQVSLKQFSVREHSLFQGIWYVWQKKFEKAVNINLN